MDLRRTLIAAAAGLVGGAGGATLALALDDPPPARTAAPAARAPAAATPVASGDALTPGEVYDRASDAVAFIDAGQGTGTGFVISPDGFLVTNAHVVGDAREVEVKIGDGDAMPARIVGTDASTDLALLKVDPGDAALPALELADSSTVRVGDPAYAIGNPLGLDRTLTAGVVSALERSIDAPNGFSITDVIQTDAPINPGNSGGPLLDASGRVIGVNSQIATAGSRGNVGIGFAVPANTVERVVEQLRETGRATHAYLGVSLGDAPEGGAAVGAVTPGGPADRAGLRPGDLITRAGGEAVDGSHDVTSAVDAQRPGEELDLTIQRNGQAREVSVTLGTRPGS